MVETDRRKAGTANGGTSAVAGLWSRAVDGLAVLGTLMIVALMVMICADVLARNVLGASLPLISELGALTVVMIVFLQLGTAIRNDRLARSEFVMLALARKWPKAAAMLNALFAMLGMCVCVAIAWSTFGILQRDFEHAEFIGVPGIMTMQTWPFRALILVGAIAATIQFLVQAVRHLRHVAGAAEIGS